MLNYTSYKEITLYKLQATSRKRANLEPSVYQARRILRITQLKIVLYFDLKQRSDRTCVYSEHSSVRNPLEYLPQAILQLIKIFPHRSSAT